jgi:hypothetical protein
MHGINNVKHLSCILLVLAFYIAMYSVTPCDLDLSLTIQKELAGVILSLCTVMA